MKVSSEGLLDISPLIRPQLAVWPQDQPFERRVVMDVEEGDHLTLSSITTTVHLGAHADAPNHYRQGGGGIASRSLAPYLGPAELMRVSVPRGERIYPRHLPRQPSAPRLLLHTGSYPEPEDFNEDFVSLSPELVHALADQGVCLIGIDTPSVDPFSSKALESHQALADRDLSVLEGLVLEAVPEGHYTLIALPLRLEGADASPVRAVLLPA